MDPSVHGPLLTSRGDSALDGCMERQRVVVIGHHLLRDLVGRLLSERADIDVVTAESDTPLLQAVDDADADFVIIRGSGSELGASCADLLQARPAVRALTINEDGRRGVLFEMRPHRVPLRVLSKEVLVSEVLRRGRSRR